MFKLRYLFPALILCAAAPSVSQAQTSIPLSTTTYSIQVEKEHWRSGGRFWLTIFQTESQNDAELMLDLLEAALEAGVICEIVGCGPDYHITDVRMTSKTVWNIYPSDYQLRQPVYQQDWYYQKK